ncbi:MAG: hypothetical protein ACYCXB_10060 [Candidatus Humimicrobiaceae bacterium]
MPRKFLIIWELPQILLALILYAIMKKRIIKAIDYKDSKVFFVKDFSGGISLSFIIFLNEIDLNNLKAIKHEYGHTIQSLYLGWFYLVIVGLPSIIRASIWKHYKLEDKKYYEGFPENWADLLGGIEGKGTVLF